MLEGHEPRAVPREELHHVGADLELARVCPAREEDDEGGSEDEKGRAAAEIDERIHESLDARLHLLFGPCLDAPA
jgi:hypothetical protein